MKKIMENELNTVTGGYMMETSDDSFELQKDGYMDHSYILGELMIHWVDYSAQVDAGWAKAGITSVSKPFGSNRYFKDGKEISRELALYMIGYRTLAD